MRPRNRELARQVTTRLALGKSLADVARELGITRQRVRQIADLDRKYEAIEASPWAGLSVWTRRSLSTRLGLTNALEAVTPAQLVDQFMEEDLRVLGPKAFAELRAFLLKGGFRVESRQQRSIRPGGVWTSIATHDHAGRRLAWPVDTRFTVVSVSEDAITISCGTRHYRVSPRDLQDGFVRTE